MNEDNAGLAVVSQSRRSGDKHLSGISEEVPSPKRKESCLEKVLKLLAEKCKLGKTAIFTHPCPDPDAIGSMMGLAWCIRKAFDAEVDCFYDGHVSHPQNQRMCNLLDPELHLFDKFKNEDYALRVCVDTVPAHCACPQGMDFDLDLDHHKEIPNGGFKGLFLNLRAGSCCATIYQIIKALGLHFEEDNEADSKVATALLVGIITDTEYQTSDDTTEYEHDAYRELFEFRNSTALKQIIRYKHPKEWVEARSRVAMKAHDRIKDGILIHGIGFIDAGNRDLVAAVADEMLSWENVETAVAFAVIDGNRIEGSVRSGNAAIAVPTLCKELGGQYGGGGGKLNKGAYYYNLGSMALDAEMDESTKEKMWEFINDRETKRLYKAIRK
jgi:nanoRNase/pAp phosphatase (c-di-AMP/oligoRNAs hydrolase)